MGKGGKVDCRRNFKRSRSKDIGSDDSDEDYVVERDASDDESENFGESVDEYASEESFDSFIEEEEEEEEEEFRKVVRSKSRKRSRAKARNRKISVKISRKRKRVSYKEDEEDKVEEDDFVNDDDEEEDDEEFTPDDVDDDFVDEDEDLRVAKRSNNMKVNKRTKPEKVHKRPRTKRRNSKIVKKPRRLKRKVRIECEDDEFEGDFIDESSVSRERSRKNSGPRRRNSAVSSDSEFVLSGSSDDDDYTISEEEREQVREAKVKANLRSSFSTKKIEEDGDVCQQVKPLPKKGKEKLKEVKAEIPKQVCGICLSEEDKRRFKGLLDCCSHYFCFTCIMEWSKVESRCPLCKQRFKTITKNGRTAGAIGVHLKNVVIDVPKRDQVYQPSEEEIRSFIDPYENVICTECHEGGDDGLMLLCDLCDSPAHTYCVGLGRQVPEGNWYCDGCKPVALGSSSSQSQDPLPDIRPTRPSPVGTNGDNMANPGLESSPGVVFNLASPRFPSGDTEVVSPASVSGAPTLSVRRQLHRHIQNIISSNRMFNMASRMDSSIPRPGFQSGHLNPQIDRFSETSIQNSRIQDMSQSMFIDERLQRNDHPSSSVQNYNPFSLRTGHLGVHDPTITAPERPANLTLWPELSSLPSHQYNRPGVASEIGLSPHRAREESQFYAIKEQLELMVKTHLRNLSQDIGLGNDTLKDIARSSTHTILAVCGLEHKSEVQVVPEPSICCHGDRLIAGQTSIMKGFCSGCFDSYVRDVVKRIMDTRLPPGWLSLGL